MICCLIPDDGGPSFLWGTWLALGYAGLRIESLWGMLYPFAVALVRMWRFNADGVAANEYLTNNLLNTQKMDMLLHLPLPLQNHINAGNLIWRIAT